MDKMIDFKCDALYCSFSPLINYLYQIPIYGTDVQHHNIFDCELICRTNYLVYNIAPPPRARYCFKQTDMFSSKS